MGLGKTILTIAAVERLIDEEKVAGGLCIMPSSLKYQWEEQILSFTDGQANVCVVDGSLKQRILAYDEILAGRVEYAILNYEQVVNDWQYIKHLPRDFIVIDEATALKNAGAQRTRKVKKLKAQYQWALTGQPVENRAEEVFSIMEWVDPSVLGPADVFDSTFIVRDYWGKVQSYVNLPLLHKTLSRSMARATWKTPGVAEQIPSVVEESIIVGFDPAGAKLYRRIVADLKDSLSQVDMKSSFDLDRHYTSGDSTGFDAKAGEVMSRFLSLRMLCDHPDLIRHSAKAYDDPLTKMGSVYASDLVTDGLLDGVNTSPKMKTVVELIKDILSADPANKVVLFSFFKQSLYILSEETKKITESVLFTGDSNQRDRQAAKKRFQTDPGVRLFLSSDAGGYGVDLPQANYLISLDLPWSSGAWAQRNARIVRLSSQFDHVTVLSVLMRGSIEERQYAALQQKQSIAEAVVDGTGFDTKGRLNITLATLGEFLAVSDV